MVYHFTFIDYQDEKGGFDASPNTAVLKLSVSAEVIELMVSLAQLRFTPFRGGV